MTHLYLHKTFFFLNEGLANQRTAVVRLNCVTSLYFSLHNDKGSVFSAETNS